MVRLDKRFTWLPSGLSLPAGPGVPKTFPGALVLFAMPMAKAGIVSTQHNLYKGSYSAEILSKQVET